jgi:2-phosphoglycerate kinase
MTPSDLRVLLIGGTSNTGKSTVARAAADRLGFEYASTDGLARHPGRPWRTPDWEVPPHVAEHYRTLTVDELTESVLGHYERLWPRVAEMVSERVSASERPGLVLEGSALLPARVAALHLPHITTVWLTADEGVIRDRIRTAGRYAEASEQERLLMDKFLARTLRYQAEMRADIARLALRTIDSGADEPVTKLVDAVFAAR